MTTVVPRHPQPTSNPTSVIPIPIPTPIPTPISASTPATPVIKSSPIVIVNKSSPRAITITNNNNNRSGNSSPNSNQVTPPAPTPGSTITVIQKSHSASTMPITIITSPNRSVNASPIPPNRPTITVGASSASTSTSSTSSSAHTSATLQCHNCDEWSSPLAVWCMECFDEERKDMDTETVNKGSDSSRARALRPFVLCETCDGGLHKPAKMSKHTRAPFQCKLRSFDTKLSSLCCWSCSTPDVHQWCRDCLQIFCTECSRDLHTAKAKKLHQRFPIHQASTRYALTATKHAIHVNEKGATTSTSITPTGKSAGGGHSKHGGGDVLHVFEPHFDESAELRIDTLEFRNTHNAFDTIGSKLAIASVSCSQHHAGAVTFKGSLFMWGNNHDGQLGFDTGEEKEAKEPHIVVMPDSTPIKQVACGHEHTIALGTNGSVFSWGSGLMGVLGHETDSNKPVPTRLNMSNLPTAQDAGEEIVYVAAGYHNSGMIVRGRANAQMYLWGAGQSGQLGLGDREPRLRPTPVQLLDQQGKMPEILQIALGTQHTVAITKQGHCYTWGSNSFGQLGFPPSRSSAASSTGVVPSPSPPPSGVPPLQHQTSFNDDSIESRPRLVSSLITLGVTCVAVGCGERHTSVLSDAGTIWSWGSGETHQMGVFDNVDQFNPVQTQTLGSSVENRVVSLSVGASLTAACTESGDVYMWGWSVESPIPKLVPGLQGHHIASIATGSAEMIACLTGVASHVLDWQFDEDDGEAAATRETSASSGNGHGHGHGHSRKASQDINISKPTEHRYLHGQRLLGISVGRAHAAAVTGAGKLLVWGSNVDHQLGCGLDSNINETVKPIEIICGDRVRIKDVKCAAEHTVALSENGQVYTWGTGSMGRLGHGNDVDIGKPEIVTGLAGQVVISICASAHNTGCVTSAHHAYVWGSAAICGSDQTPSFKPKQIATHLAKQNILIAQLAMGTNHAVAITQDGACYTWGDNGFGQLGLGDAAEPLYLEPQKVEYIKHKQLSAVACGENVTLVLSRDGLLFGWGSGETHQLGNKDQNDCMYPIEIPIPYSLDPTLSSSESKTAVAGRIVSLASGSINCAAIADNGTVWVWGWALGETPRPVTSLTQQEIKAARVAVGHKAMIITS